MRGFHSQECVVNRRRVGCFHHVLNDWIEELARFLGITIREQFHRAFHVGKQNRDLLALAFERALGCEDFFSEMLGW